MSRLRLVQICTLHLIHSLSSPLLAPAVNQRFASLREVLNDDDYLAALLGIKAIYVRRYAKGECTCPDAVAARLFGQALLIQQLEGTYNAYGIRRWFQRPRASLDGQAPQDRLQGGWDPEDAPICAICAVLALAQAASYGRVAS